MVLDIVSPEVKSEPGPVTRTKIVLVLEYDGGRYRGFQLQARGMTIQGELEKALSSLTGEKVRVITASRTDAGVHARGQVISFRTASAYPVETFINALNYYLPGDIAVKAAHRVDDSFNVRRRAVSREYEYRILNSQTPAPLSRRFVYLVRGNLDVDMMNQAGENLLGEHDFASFASDIGAEVKSTVRRVYRAEMRREGELIVFNMLANSFLPHQVRNTVGALVRVGLGKMSLEEFGVIMEARKPGLAGPMAPAGGLCLVKVNYTRPFEEAVE